MADENRQPEEPVETGGEQPDGDPEAPMDTGMPPGVHPNSDVPDPEVVEEGEREQAG